MSNIVHEENINVVQNTFNLDNTVVKVKKIEKNSKIEPKNIGIKILNKVKEVQNGSTTDKI